MDPKVSLYTTLLCILSNTISPAYFLCLVKEEQLGFDEC
jgi:hypothetical protein